MKQFSVFGPFVVTIPEEFKDLITDGKIIVLENAINDLTLQGFDLEAVIPGYSFQVNLRTALVGQPTQIAFPAVALLMSVEDI